jgi:hypothetical protein
MSKYPPPPPPPPPDMDFHQDFPGKGPWWLFALVFVVALAVIGCVIWAGVQ